MTNSRSGLFCLGFFFISSFSTGLAQQPQQPPTTPPQTETQEPQTQPTTRLPPPPPKVVDVRMPGEAGYFIGLTGWLPAGQPFVDKGKQVSFTDPSRLKIPGKSKGAPGAEIGFAAGKHNTLRISVFQAKAAGNTTAGNDLVIFSQPYSKGDLLAVNYRLQNVKLSYEFLTWPYPVENRRFRLKTLWQVQYVSLRSNYDAPSKPATDSAGNPLVYSTQGSKSYFAPTLGLGVAHYASRHVRFEANASGFALPHRFNIWDADASIAYRAGPLELRGGVKAFHFHTSAKLDYYLWGTMTGAFVGLRWHSD